MTFAMTPEGERKFRAYSGVLPLSLIRKLCGCGKTITARQLTQYGSCDACLRMPK
jgi:hypothetical protein